MKTAKNGDSAEISAKRIGDSAEKAGNKIGDGAVFMLQ